MKFTMRVACKLCPFRKSKRFPLPRKRMIDLVDLVWQGDVMACHQTSGDPLDRWRACAGWLLYQRLNHRNNSILRAMEKAKLYRPRRLIKDPDVITTRQEIEEAPWFT